MNLNDLSFPVVLLGADKTISMPVDVDELTTCTPLGLRTLVGGTIIDLNGARFLIAGATKMGIKKPWWHRPLFITIIKAELTIEHLKTLSIDELKKTLIKGLTRSGWSSDNGDLIPRVKKATSLSDLRTIFSSEICSVPKWYDFSPRKGRKSAMRQDTRQMKAQDSD